MNHALHWVVFNMSDSSTFQAGEIAINKGCYCDMWNVSVLTAKATCEDIKILKFHLVFHPNIKMQIPYLKYALEMSMGLIVEGQQIIINIWFKIGLCCHISRNKSVILLERESATLHINVFVSICYAKFHNRRISYEAKQGCDRNVHAYSCVSEFLIKSNRPR